MYFNLYQQGKIGDFYDHDSTDKPWFDKFYREGADAIEDFSIVASSLKS